MPQELPYLLLITLATLLICMIFSMLVSAKRRKHSIPAPAMIGHPELETAIRVHYNTIEQLVLFLPSLWIFFFVGSPFWANILGIIWILGRVLYGIGYYYAPLKRYPGFALTILPTMVLMFGSIFQVAVMMGKM